MKYAATVLAATVLAGCASQPATRTNAEATTNQRDCQQLYGRWGGEKLWSNGDISTWVAEHHRGQQHEGKLVGKLHIELESTRNGHPVRNIHDGAWSCDGDLLQTATRDAVGRQQQFRYRILELDNKHIRYQYLEDDGTLGTTYEATRLGDIQD